MDGDDGGGFFYSIDEGQNWKKPSGQPASRRIYNALAADPSRQGRLYWGAVGKNGGVFRSDDHGKTWKKVFSESSVFDLAINPQGMVLAGGDFEGACLYTSEDAGTSWKLIQRFDAVGTLEAIAIDPGNPKRIAVSSVLWHNAAPGKIYFTEDGGQTWADITGSLPSGSGAAAMAFSSDGRTLYVSRYAGSIYKTHWESKNLT